MLKRFLCVMLVLCMLLAFSACKKGDGGKLSAEGDAKQENIEEEFAQLSEDFELFIMDGYEDEFEEISEDFEDAVLDEDTELVKKYFQEMKALKEKVATANKKQLDEIIKGLEKEKSLAKEERQELDEALERAKKYIEKSRYLRAYEKLSNYMMFVPDAFESEEMIDIDINQVDCSEYPLVRLFVTARNAQGKTPDNLDKKYFTVIENNDNIRRQIMNVMQLDKKEGISINIVADASGSMEGEPIVKAKSTMSKFLGQVQYEYGDKIALTVFESTIDTQTGFSADYSQIDSYIDDIYAGGGTALYDTLYTSVQYTARQNGARCIIAFTDGMDEHSVDADSKDVIRVANDYKIPIFIIGIGASANVSEIADIANSTGGFYRNIENISDLSEIYNAIYRQQKEMYVVEYTSDENKKYSEHLPVVSYKSMEYEGKTHQYAFIPSQINPATNDNSKNELEVAIRNYLESYVEAMNTKNSEHMLPYVIKDCPLYNTQKNYINNDYEEKLLSFYICSEVKMEAEDSCVLSVHEIYEVKEAENPFRHHEQVATYRMKKDIDGKWKMYAFVEKVQNHL